MTGLRGSIVIVTGAAGALGSAIARRLDAEGARVVATDRNAGGLAALPGIAVPGDATLPATADAVVAAALALGGIDGVVLAAGIDPYAARTVPETSVDDFDAIMHVNVRAPFLLLRRAIPEMAARGGGAVVGVASIAADRPMPAEAAYAASKAALAHLVRCVARDHAADGIRANIVNPGMLEAIMADRAAAMSEAERAARAAAADAATPLARRGRPDEIAEAVVFLLDRNRSSFTTGATITVDGGISLT